MVDRATKLRWRRRFRRKQKQVETLGSQAEQQLETHVFKRLNRFVSVRRFILGWFLLFGLIISGVVVQSRTLSQFYQTLEPGEGGIFSEGIEGSFTNANPIYATSPVDASVSRLVFSSLMRYDNNNRLVGDLAKKIDIDDGAAVYKVHLRENVFWHDGRPLTADDVVFTYKTIQKPDAQSPLLPNWQKVAIKATGKYEVEFRLPHGLASFTHSLTNGIVPSHILKNVPSDELRSIEFNTVNPIGSGPFRWDAVQVTGGTPQTREEQIGLVANDMYHHGKPKLERFFIRAFHDEATLSEAFDNNEVQAAAGLDAVPASVQDAPAHQEYSVPLTGEVLVFLKNSNTVLKDRAVRQALSRATDQEAVIKELGYPVVFASGPLLNSHIGYSEKATQLETSMRLARRILDKNGWRVGKNGIRYKGNQELAFKLYSQSDSQYSRVAQALQKQWRKLGVNLDVRLQPDTELQAVIASHSYDALLYGITIGSDPDVYAYWHSSQADLRSSKRLNLSEYKSTTADAALEAGRGRLDPKTRAAKYRPFLDAWRKDAPAIALYQPRYLYVINTRLYGFDPTEFNSPVDRYANVENWAIRQDRVNIY